MELRVIARARNGFEDKFGIPRQPSEASLIETRIVFEPEFRHPEALRGIEEFSHLWLVWGFGGVESRKTASLKVESDSWSATVRPPRLGGNKRMGVFATRSPNRPNPLGISSVRLLRVEDTKDGKVLVVNGADLLDGTAIFDVKPYLRYSDSHPDAVDGFAEKVVIPKREVVYEMDEAELATIEPRILREIEEILVQDPRPAYHEDDTRVYKMDYSGYNITFSINRKSVKVKNVTNNAKK